MKRTQLLCLALLAACGDLEPDPGDPTLSGVVVTDVGDGTYRLDVDASDEAAWVYFDLDTQRAADAAAWDLGFKRFLVKTNGGSSGDAGVRVAAVATDFDDLDVAPVAGWTEDRPSEDAPTDKPDDILESDIDHAFNQPNAASENGWYDYDPVDHTLSAADVVFVVESDAGRFYKVRFERYYDDAGSPAILTLRFGEIDPPEDTGTIDASEGWTYLRIGDGVVTTTAEALDWDVAISRTILATNGGTSGAGLGGAAWAEASARFDDIDEVSTFGFVGDEELPVPGPPGSGTISQNAVLGEWYDYDPATHAVSPKDRVLLVRGADGERYGKLQILDYEDGAYRLVLEPVTAAPEAATLELDASDGAAWVHIDLTSGRLVDTASASADLGWDIAFSRTRIRTNGGTSGSGVAGAVEMDTKFDDVTAAPSEGYVADEALPLPGPPGSGTYSGNAVLNGWYDYDPTTHTTTARDVAFVVRTAHGDFVKLAVQSWDDGVYTVRVAYAGPERSAF